MDLTTDCMGLKLATPLVVGAGPLGSELSGLRRIEDSGGAAVVLWSLFEEQISHDQDELDFYLQYGTERFPESLTYFPRSPEYHTGPEEYLNYISDAKKAVDIPIIASLNGFSSGGWISMAKQMQQAGADALELNIYFLATNPDITSQQVEQAYIDALLAVRRNVTVPVAIKLSPFFSAFASLARKLSEAGADGLVLFNRFLQPDIDLAELEVRPRLVLSNPAESRLPMRWVGILYGATKSSLIASSGLHSGQDVAKMILAGADAVQVCSILLKEGIEHLKTLRAELEEFMLLKQYDSLSQMKGVMSSRTLSEPAAFERANYMKTLSSFGRTMTFE
ncbi:MAG: dihydroorotate dehydrogenase-like protein [Planctomycetes bacterium]|nr:dihydroorotate dehydrogenase-like protein [Planctomycetota bacterium]